MLIESLEGRQLLSVSVLALRLPPVLAEALVGDYQGGYVNPRAGESGALVASVNTAGQTNPRFFSSTLSIEGISVNAAGRVKGRNVRFNVPRQFVATAEGFVKLVANGKLAADGQTIEGRFTLMVVGQGFRERSAGFFSLTRIAGA